MKKGTIVNLNVPFQYEIGEEGPVTGNILNTIEDCIEEVRAELNDFDGTNANVEVGEIEEVIKYILSDFNVIYIRGENPIELNEKIFDEELFEYKIIHKEDLIEDLMMWISEANKDKELMKQDLKELMQVKDDYIFSSISTNDYIYQGCDDFDSTCEELIKLNKTLK